MSLLMDALKKAEQEKKDAAKRLISAEDELSVTRKDAFGEITGPHLNINNEPAVEQETGKQADKTYNTSSMDLSLEPLESPAHHPLIHKRAAEKITILARYADKDPDTTLNVTAENLSLKPQFEQITKDTVADSNKMQEVKLVPTDTFAANDLDQTFHGVDLEKPLVAGLYEDTIQGEPFRPGDTNRSYDETLPGVPAAQLARDIGIQDQPTPVAAQTLFTATNTITKSSTGFKWLLISLCVFAIGSTVVVYYYSVTPVSRNIPSPLVAKGVETIISSQDIQAVAIANVTAPVDSSTPVVAGTDSGTSAAETATTDQSQPAPTVTTETPTTPEPVVAETPVSESAPVTTETASTETDSLPARIEPPASLVKISRSMNTTAENQLVTEAFSAYQQANYDLARQKYEQAYEQSPDNRDVLLGLAAVATKTGDSTRALQIYIRLVQLNPLDNVARAALIGIQPGEDLSSSISVVKSMLFESPQQPSLYFTLGRLYATQSKWPEAQQAFFDAYRLDSANPDYAFNLAVSLDRMDQSQSALDYYTVALGLSENNPAGFSRAAVADRIQTLETSE